MYLKRFEHLYDIDRVRIPEPENVRLRLQRNEKPDAWPPAVYEAAFGSIPPPELQHYPDARPFYEKLSAFLDIPEERLVVTSSIDEPIRTLMTLCCDADDTFAVPWPGYAMYDVYSRILAIRQTRIVYEPDRFMPPEEFVSQIDPACRLVFLPNPNQLVENHFDIDQLSEIADHCRSRDILLAVDEAYHFLGATSAMPLIDRFDNVVVMRTYSKAFGGASLRLGYVAGSERAIKPLQSYRLAHESNALSLHVGCTFLDRFTDLIEPGVRGIRDGRDYLREACLEHGFKAWGEVSNNVLIDLGTADTMTRVVAALRERGIFVKSAFPAPVDHHIQVSCGPVEMMQDFFGNLADVWRSNR